MKIKDITKQDPGFQYIVDSMELMSAAGRRVMGNTPLCNDADSLHSEWNRLQAAIDATLNPDNKRHFTDLRHCFMQLHDLQGTLSSLAAHTPLNEVELFEIKNLSHITSAARRALAGLGLDSALPLPDLEEVFSILDPDHTGIANFYIYDSYDPRLTPLRRELKTLQENGGDPGRISQLLAEQNSIQNRVCTDLSDRLHSHANILAEALEQLAYADFLMAKADLSVRWNLVRPALTDHIHLEALWNPRLKHRNEELGLRYQNVDVTLHAGTTLITGANMAGKTVLLKSIGTAQAMAQCGFYMPAAVAETTLFDAVATSIGDEQDEMNGLSSYASEIIKISNILQRSREERMLILIDEPARTTNPVEGKALVQAITTILEQAPSTTLITTHYGQLGTSCRRLRVKGFVEGMENVPLTPQNINRFIDYSLTEDLSGDVPHEALRIAAILGCDSEMIALAQGNLQGQ